MTSDQVSTRSLAFFITLLLFLTFSSAGGYYIYALLGSMFSFFLVLLPWSAKRVYYAHRYGYAIGYGLFGVGMLLFFFLS
jgi:hypothetical protein